jgi:hypothetical protein
LCSVNLSRRSTRKPRLGHKGRSQSCCNSRGPLAVWIKGCSGATRR